MSPDSPDSPQPASTPHLAQQAFDPRHQAELALIGAAFVAGMRSTGSGPLSLAGADETLPPEKPRCVHQIPSLPVLLDGKRAAPESVKDFDGKPLYYLLDERARDGESLLVFTDAAKAAKALAGQKIDGKPKTASRAPAARGASLGPGSSPQQVADVIGGSVFLWDDIHYRGAQWRFGAGTSGYPSRGAGDGNIADFRRVFGFLWFFQNINDRVSSVSNQSEVWANIRPQRSFAVLHQHINFQGAQLWVPERAAFPDLRVFGWNDVPSSMSYALTAG